MKDKSSTSNNIITIMGICVILMFSVVQILKFAGVGLDAYGIYLYFFIFIFPMNLLFLPSSYPKIDELPPQNPNPNPNPPN